MTPTSTTPANSDGSTTTLVVSDGTSTQRTAAAFCVIDVDVDLDFGSYTHTYYIGEAAISSSNAITLCLSAALSLLVSLN